jgi:carbon-monoxide dehydrogenase large subunit
MATTVFGSGIRRREDRGSSPARQPTDDFVLPGMVHAAMLRSPHAHAKITRIDSSKAKAAPGVVAVYAGSDIEGLQPSPCAWLVPNSELKVATYHCAAKDTVRYVGDIVAIVVAETPNAAYDALELVDVDYQPLPSVTDPEQAVKSGAPQLHAEIAGNQAFHWVVAGGDVDAAFKNAELVITERIVQQRLIRAMEPRATLAKWSPASD